MHENKSTSTEFVGVTESKSLLYFRHRRKEQPSARSVHTSTNPHFHTCPQVLNGRVCWPVHTSTDMSVCRRLTTAWGYELHMVHWGKFHFYQDPVYVVGGYWLVAYTDAHLAQAAVASRKQVGPTYKRQRVVSIHVHEDTHLYLRCTCNLYVRTLLMCVHIYKVKSHQIDMGGGDVHPFYFLGYGYRYAGKTRTPDFTEGHVDGPTVSGIPLNQLETAKHEMACVPRAPPPVPEVRLLEGMRKARPYSLPKQPRRTDDHTSYGLIMNAWSALGRSTLAFYPHYPHVHSLLSTGPHFH